jgi:hypothetical protein
MNSSLVNLILAALLGIAILPANRAHASGLFSYTETASAITITGYPKLASGPVEIPDAINGKPVTRVSFNAFRDCVNITSVSIPPTVTQINNNAFSGCASLAQVSLADGLTQIGTEAFSDCISLVSITIPSTVTQIQDRAFHRCASLTAIHVDALSANFSSIDGVLYNKNANTLIKYPNARQGAFAIQDYVKIISGNAFADCPGLTGITIPHGVTTINSLAFARCSALTTVFIPATVTAISIRSFEDCLGITSYTVNPENPNFSDTDGVLYNKSQTTLIHYPQARVGAFAIPHTVATLSTAAFRSAAFLTDVTLPPGLASIPSEAFARCGGLINIALPAALTTIGSFAFTHCASLPSIAIPPNVSEISATAFNHCPELAEILVDPLNPHYQDIDGVLFNKALTTLVKYPQPKPGDFAVPPTVTTVEGFAFIGCLHLTALAIPAATTTMVRISFNGCSKLQAIHVAAANPNFSSIDGVLFNKTAATLIRCPEAKAGNYTTPPQLTSIQFDAFMNCMLLTKITVHGSVTILRNRTFQNCEALQKIDLPDTLLVIEASAFQGCESLEDVIIPAAVTTVGDMAFAGCDALSSITFPPAATDIGAGAFQDTPSLISAIFLGNAPAIAAFGNPFQTFGATNPAFTAYHFSTASGFSSPTWQGYPSASMGPPSSWAPWLASYGLPTDCDPFLDANGDGVPLLLAYAFHLNPSRNLPLEMPRPRIANGHLEIGFHGARDELTYTIETSEDLAEWTTNHATLTSPDADGRRIASTAIDSTRRFLRIAVTPP